MAFNPKTTYEIVPDKIDIRDFYAYRDEYITRPPYQRKNVWSLKKKQALLDSLIRRYYVPKLVIRVVRLSEDRTVNEVIDGQQRITAVQEFFDDKIRLPKSLGDISAELPGKLYSQLNSDMKRFMDKGIKYELDLIKGIDDPKNTEHQKIATEIFWRLQQGESLNFMEIAHAKLASLSRNFVVKYSDDISFDFDQYKPVDNNRFKHNFFSVIDRDNNRMQHLMLMSRLAMIEEADGYTDLKDTALTEFIEKHETEDGIGNHSYEKNESAKQVLNHLTFLNDLFKEDSMIDERNGIKELQREYLIVSLYLLVRHLRKYYVMEDLVKNAIKSFFLSFHTRWKESDPEDTDMVVFVSNRQQSLVNLQMRDMVFRQLFFEYCSEHQIEVKTKDEKRAFSEAQRIKIYRRDKGMCQQCLAEKKPEKEALVSWSYYQADHVVPHARGGETSVENAQVLCATHNQRKGAKVL